MISINFSDPAFIRKCQSKAQDLLLIKAIGLHKRKPLTILDTCAGRGQDALLMAYFSGIVTALERNEQVFAALQQALTQLDKRFDTISPIQLLHNNAIDYLAALSAPYPDVIYIDPMYPTPHKSERHKHDLKIMRQIVGNDEDAAELLHNAWGKAIERIVVKRPKRAPLLADKTPSFQQKGSSTRFDIYLSSEWQCYNI